MQATTTMVEAPWNLDAMGAVGNVKAAHLIECAALDMR